jgi:hypothetical protein
MYQPFRTSWQTVTRPSTSFPLPPLKFRTASFPQYGFKPAHAAATFTGRFLPAYRPPLSACRLPAFIPQSAGPELLKPTTGPVALGSPSGSIVRSVHRLLWPHLRLCRPPVGLWIIPPGCGLPRSTAEGPQFTLPVLSPMPSPVPRWSQRLHSTMSSSLVLPCAELAPARRPRNPTTPDQVGSVSGLQRSLYATAWTDCLSCSGQDFYYRAFLGRVTPCPKSVITRWLHHLLPSPDFHRLDWQPYGLRANPR